MKLGMSDMRERVYRGAEQILNIC